MKDNIPFKEAYPSKITQRFSEEHQAIDIMAPYGTWLVAPQNCTISNIVTSNSVREDLAPLSRGYGIMMRDNVNPFLFYLYWHCLPIFPVQIGDEVKKGQQVAQMGNSGFVKYRGYVVPVELRTKEPYFGTHVHYEKFIENGSGERIYTNPEPDIDWSSSVDSDWLSEAKVILLNIKKLLAGKQ